MKNHSSCLAALPSALLPLVRVPRLTCYMLDPVEDRPLADCTHVQQSTKLAKNKISHAPPRVGSYVSRALC